MKLGRWSTVAGSNNSTPPDGAPEGMAPSTVNDTMREMMASIRTAFTDLQYFDPDFTPTYISATTFSVTGNQTSAIHAGRRLKVFDATAGVATTIYATVTTASFTTVTTIAISADAGQLTSSLSSFAIAILSRDNPSLPQGLPVSASSVATGTLTVTGTTTASGAVSLLTTLSVSGAAAFAGNATVAGVLTASVIAATSSLNVGSGTAQGSLLRVLTNTAPNFDPAGGNAARISYGGGATAGEVGAGLVFSQRYTDTDLAQIGVGGIFGVKTSGLGTFGGGLLLYAKPPGAGDLIEVARLTDTSFNVHTAFSVSGGAVITGATTLESTLSVSGATVLKGALSVGGAVIVAGATQLAGTLSVSGTVVAANVAKAWGRLNCSTAPTLVQSFNIASISRSAVGVFRITFSTAFSTANYSFLAQPVGRRAIESESAAATTFKFTVTDPGGTAVDSQTVNIQFQHT